MPNVIRIRIEGTGDQDVIAGLRRIDRVTDEVDHSLTEAGRAAERMGREGEQAGHEVQQSMERAAEATADVGDSAEGSSGLLGALGEEGSGAMDNLAGAGGKVGEVLGKLGPYGKAAAVAIGVGMLGAGLAVKTFMSLVEKANQRTMDLAQSKAVLGITGADAARFGKVAGKVYTDNWGESIKDAGDTVRNAALYIMPSANAMGNAITPSLKVVSEKVAALAATMDDDSKHVSFAIQRMLVTGMAKSVGEAFDLIHAGISSGADSADDLLDTMNEYGTQFRKLGIDGATAIGLLSQGLKGGARDADLVADAFKEFSIRAIDGSATTIDGFKQLGLNAEKMQAQIAKGGPSARAGLEQVLDLLKGVKDPAKQAAIATELFGTQAEDLGKALFALDPKTAAAGLGQIAGAADKAAATLSAAPMASIDAYKRKWEMFQADMGDKLVPTFERFLGKVEKFVNDVAPTVQYMLGEISKKFNENRDAIEQFGKLMEIVFGVVGKAAIAALYEGIMGLLDVVALIGAGWMQAKVAFVTGGLIMLNVLGWLIDAAAAAFGWIPGIGPKLKDAARDFEEFKNRANVALAGIVDKDVHVRVLVSQSGSIAPIAGGGGNNLKGIRFSAAGGLGGGLPTMVNEGGPELIDWQAGRVHNFQETRRMLSGGGGGGSPTIVLAIKSTGRAPLAEAILDALATGLNRGDIELTADSGTGAVRVA